MKKSIAKITALSVASLGVYVVVDPERREATALSIESARRIANLGVTATSIAVDYAWYMYQQKGKALDEESKLQLEFSELQSEQEKHTYTLWAATDSEEIASIQKAIRQTRVRIDEITERLASLKKNNQNEKSLIHRRSAMKLREMCANNKGLYIKLGQHVSMLDHIIPEEYQDELYLLLSNNPVSSYESVRRTIKKDLGKYPEELFASFDPNPIASASLAQVHVAFGNDGKKYAVKVHHEGLLENSQSDMRAVTFAVDILSKLFTDFNYTWLTREMNRNLPRELDFQHEMGNVLKCKEMLKNLIEQEMVVVPDVAKELSSTRVLTMSFEEGKYVSDDKALVDMKIDKSQLSRIISNTFCQQIFRYGFVHCDPHEANLLVRPHPRYPDRPQLVLLDHGLYRELDDSFRRDYCRLWRALVCSDEANIKKYCQKMNAGDLFTLLAAVLTMKPWDDITSDDITRLHNKGTASESVMLSSYAAKYYKEIVTVLNNVPSDMLLLMKTNDCLRHLDRRLRTPINTATVVAEVTSAVILEEDLKEAKTYSEIAQAYSDFYNVQSRLIPLYSMETYFKWLGYLNGK